MKLEIHTLNNTKIAEVISEGLIIKSTEEGLDLLGDLYYQDFDKIILHEDNITPEFFDLRTGIAGAILQKFSNYRVRLAVVGDFTKYQGKSIKEFIFESNKVRNINFVASTAEAIDVLLGIRQIKPMNSIVKAKQEDYPLLTELGRQTFWESHGNSASAADISAYTNEKYSFDVFREELSDPKNVYYIIYHDGKAAGYSKIIFNATHPIICSKNATKLERLYLLKDFYDLKLGYKLFEFNIEVSKKNGQEGMWLFVWKENYRAVNFYEKAGFKIVGSHEFKITETHSNPNHHMFLKY